METERTVGAQLERWLAKQTLEEPEESVFWAPHGWRQPSDWVEVRGLEHLAVLISTAIHRDDNVCAVSGSRGRVGRVVNVIGLITRQPLGWAVVISEAGDPASAADVRRRGYPHDNYDSFSALTAAEISWSWVTAGEVPNGLDLRMRKR